MTPAFFLVLFLQFHTLPMVYQCPTWQCVSQLVDQHKTRGLFKAQVFDEKPFWDNTQLVTVPLAEYVFN